MKLGFATVSFSAVLFAAEVLPQKEIAYVQTTKLEEKMGEKISVIKNGLSEKIKEESRELKRIKIEELDNAKSLRTKLVSDYEAYMTELKRQSNELKDNRYTIREFEEIQKTIVELSGLHKKNQEELKVKIEGLSNGTFRTKKMDYLVELVEKQKTAMAKLVSDFNNIRTNHINHKNMLKDTFYVDLENLKRKYHNDNQKLQELYKINVGELVKNIDSKKEELRLDYWEVK